MISLNIDNLSRISTEHGLTNHELERIYQMLPKHLESIRSKDLGFYQTIDDHNIVSEIKKIVKEKSAQYQHIVVLGTGGSALGTICLKQSLTHLFKPCDLHVLDNIDPVIIEEIKDIIDLSKTLFIVVTKSGSTPETISQFFYFKDLYKKTNYRIQDHFVFITDPKNGLLRQIAEKEQFLNFPVPENVGGRFSVLSAVGLLPAAMIGIDIDALLKGARNMRDQFLNKNAQKNMPFKLAVIQFLLAGKGKTINVMTPYAQKLIKFTDWYRQLLAESIGKKKNNKGKNVYTGITPVNALGTTDQHSQSQLYNEGPNDKLHMFIKVNKLTKKIKIPLPYPKEKSVSYLNGVTFNKLIEKEMEGTVKALTQNDRPNITLNIDRIDEQTLGELLMLFEASTAFLGELFNINAFDQPGVELSKKITKQLLSND